MDSDNILQLRDELIFPDKKVLTSVLKKSYAVYTELIELYDRNELNYEWRYYKDGKAWLCKVQKKKKTIVWMSAWNGFMQAAIYFPVRLLNEILELDINEELKENILNTKNVGKSKPCIFEIRDKDVLADFEKVMLLKINSK
jgi:hypothetical protein